MPPIQAAPAPDFPFIFYHMRKCGGSSLRQGLADSFNTEFGQSAFSSPLLPSSPSPPHLPLLPAVIVMCYTVPCDQFALAPRAPKWSIDRTTAMVAGHVPFGSHDLLLSSLTPAAMRPSLFHEWGQNPIKGMRSRRKVVWTGPPRFQCLTVLRNPITRIISCYYYRFFEVFANRPLSAFTPQGMREMLLSWRDNSGHGCLNEHLRIFSGMVDEDTVGALLAGDPLGEMLTQRAATQNLPRCIVLSLEQWNTSLHHLYHYAPWIDPWALPSVRIRNSSLAAEVIAHSSSASAEGAVYSYRDEGFSKEQFEVLQELSDLERRFFQYGMRVFEHQKPRVPVTLPPKPATRRKRVTERFAHTPPKKRVGMPTATRTEKGEQKTSA